MFGCLHLVTFKVCQVGTYLNASASTSHTVGITNEISQLNIELYNPLSFAKLSRYRFWRVYK